MKPRITLSRIAEACGVSKAAVSYALRGSDQVSVKLTKAIQQKASDLGYIPSRTARLLNGHTSPRLGIVLSLPGVPMESQILQALEAVCRETGFEAVVRYHYWHAPTECNILRSLLDEGVTGLVMVPAHLGTTAELVRLQEAGLSAPIVTVGLLHHRGEELITYLGNFAPDYQSVAPLCLKHVAEAGHQNVAVLFQGPYTNSGGAASLAQSFLSTASHQGNLRIEMFYLDDTSSAIRQKILQGVPCALEDVWKTDNQLAEHFLNHPFEATVAITSDDLTALSLLRACHDRSIKVPQDLSIFSMGGSWACRMAPLSITHVEPNIEGIATRIISMFLDDTSSDHEEVAYPLSIVEGETLISRDSKNSTRIFEKTISTTMFHGRSPHQHLQYYETSS